jgi:flagellin-like protein
MSPLLYEVTVPEDFGTLLRSKRVWMNAILGTVVFFAMVVALGVAVG